MLTSKELRARARESLAGKYWSAFAAAIILTLLFTPSSFLSGVSSSFLAIAQKILQGGMELSEEQALGVLAMLALSLGSMLVSVLIGIFTTGPLFVGACSYFIKNAEEKPRVSEVFAGFKTRYGRNMWAAILVYIKTALWSLLFIVPGIIKSLEYSIIPYILADDPEISAKDAFRKAKLMMSGNKWRIFKLTFSFFGWVLLGALTLGIGMFFILPYMQAALAEFYIELKNK